MFSQVFEKVADENLRTFRDTSPKHVFWTLRRLRMMRKREEKEKKREEKWKKDRTTSCFFGHWLLWRFALHSQTSQTSRNWADPFSKINLVYFASNSPRTADFFKEQNLFVISSYCTFYNLMITSIRVRYLSFFCSWFLPYFTKRSCYQVNVTSMSQIQFYQLLFQIMIS